MFTNVTLWIKPVIDEYLCKEAFLKIREKREDNVIHIRNHQRAGATLTNYLAFKKFQSWALKGLGLYKLSFKGFVEVDHWQWPVDQVGHLAPPPASWSNKKVEVEPDGRLAD